MLINFYSLVLILILWSCAKEDPVPVPVDLFAGNHGLVEVIEEYRSTDSQSESFTAPEVFEITKSDFLDPASGERVTAYKFNYGDRFMGMISSEDNVIVGTEICPNNSDLNGVSVTFSSTDQFYVLNMLNCEGREVIANYTKLEIED